MEAGPGSGAGPHLAAVAAAQHWTMHCGCPAVAQVDKVPMAGRLHRYLADNGTVIMGTIPVSHPAEGLDPFFLVDG